MTGTLSNNEHVASAPKGGAQAPKQNQLAHHAMLAHYFDSLGWLLLRCLVPVSAGFPNDCKPMENYSRRLKSYGHRQTVDRSVEQLTLRHDLFLMIKDLIEVL
jgi:hypothetical protein